MNQARLAALVLAGSLATTMAQTGPAQLPIAKGPFAGTMDSLTNYACPEWFRDAINGSNLKPATLSAAAPAQ